MQQLIRISEIEKAAQALSVSLFALCREAGVSYPTVRRWLLGVHQPGLLDYEATCKALESVLVARRDRALAATQAFEVRA